MLNNLFKDQTPTIMLLVVMVHVVLQERRVANLKKEIHFHFRTIASANHNQAHPSLYQEGQKSFHLWHNCRPPLVDTVNQEFLSVLIFKTFSLQ